MQRCVCVHAFEALCRALHRQLLQSAVSAAVRECRRQLSAIRYVRMTAAPTGISSRVPPTSYQVLAYSQLDLQTSDAQNTGQHSQERTPFLDQHHCRTCFILPVHRNGTSKESSRNLFRYFAKLSAVTHPLMAKNPGKCVSVCFSVCPLVQLQDYT